MKKNTLLTYLCWCSLASLLSCSTTHQQMNTTLDRATSLHVTLAHNPKGTVDLRWSATTRELSVTITATGLAPNSMHPEHIHAGTCTSIPMGAIVHPLHPLVANAQGDATSITTIARVNNGIPAHGWYVNIHNGPTLNTDLEARAIACSNVKAMTTASTGDQQVHLKLVGTIAPDENVTGSASFLLDAQAKKLVVTLTVSKLTPNSMHMAHIHAGSCGAQGGIVQMLNPVVADAQGVGRSTTTITSVPTLPVSAWYVNVHEGAPPKNLHDPIPQQDFNPIACGNIV